MQIELEELEAEAKRFVAYFERREGVMSSKSRILVVEDNRSLALLYERILTRKNYDGEDGWRMARWMKPDLIILDINMPIMDGDVVYRLLQSDPGTADIPVLILTEIQETPEGLDVDASNFLSKPIAAREMLDWVRGRIGC